MATLHLRKINNIFVAADAASAEAMAGLKDGEFKCEVTRPRPRNYPFLKKYFALLKFSYDHWEMPEDAKTLKSFENFRKELAVLSGHYRQVWKLDGDFTLEAESISFANMGEEEFEKLYGATVTIILRDVLKGYTKEDLDEVVLSVLSFA
jgi:Protein of unknown function (DUF1367)